MKDIYAIILSGGTGTRLGGDIPKQYIEVRGRSILSYSMETIMKHPYVKGCVVVAAAEYHEAIASEALNLGIVKETQSSDSKKATAIDGNIIFALPGTTRQLSIYNGLKALLNRGEDMWVLVHDGARPALTGKLLDEIFAAAEGHDGVLPVLPMKDTVYQSINGNTITSLLDRSTIFAGQAPELFDFAKYLAANEALMINGEATKEAPILKINGSTEPAIMAGMDIAMIPGDEGNYKITTKADLERFM